MLSRVGLGVGGLSRFVRRRADEDDPEEPGEGPFLPFTLVAGSLFDGVAFGYAPSFASEGGISQEPYSGGALLFFWYVTAEGGGPLSQIVVEGDHVEEFDGWLPVISGTPIPGEWILTGELNSSFEAETPFVLEEGEYEIAWQSAA